MAKIFSCIKESGKWAEDAVGLNKDGPSDKDVGDSLLQAQIPSLGSDQGVISAPVQDQAAGTSKQERYNESRTNNTEKTGPTRGKKPRKMKKLILAESEDFFQDMESEADQMDSFQGKNHSRQNRQKEKRKKKLRLRTSLESASEVGNPQEGNSGESNYFVDCRQKRVGMMDCMRTEAEEFWVLGKNIGVSARSEERTIIEKLVEMECRDKEAVADSAQEIKECRGLGSNSNNLNEDPQF